MSDTEAPQSMDAVMESLYDGIAVADEPEQIAVDEPVLEAASEAVEGDVEADELETAEADTPDADDEAEGDEPAEVQTITAPQSMSAKDREAFYKLPPEQQSWLSDRAKQQEAAFTQKTMELAEQRKAFDGLEKVLAPRRQQLALDGMDESTAVGQLFALSDFANADPVGFIKYLASQRGIPLEAITEQGNYADPQLTATQRELQGVKNMLAQQQAQVSEQTTKEASSIVENFAKENPFYDELEVEMIPIVQALRQSNPSLPKQEYLAKAYKMALAANEEVSAKIQADKQAKENAKKVADAKAAASKAKRAASTNVRSGASLPPAARNSKNVDEFLGALYDERVA